MNRRIFFVSVISCFMLLNSSIDASSGSGIRYNSQSHYSSNSETENFNLSSVNNNVSHKQIQDLQLHLIELGYECGTADGVIGEKTLSAIKRYQENHMLEQTGLITDDLLNMVLDGTHEGITKECYIERYNQAVEYYNQFDHDFSKIETLPSVNIDSLMINGGFIYFSMDSQEDHIMQVKYNSASENYSNDDYAQLSCIAYAMNPMAADINDVEYIVRIIKYCYDGNANYTFLSFSGNTGTGNRFDETISYRITGKLVNSDLDISKYANDIPKEPKKEPSTEISINNKISETEKSTTKNDMSTTHICEANSCSKDGTKTITGFSGQTEYYCEEHYQEMLDIIDMMEGDVGSGEYSKHTCCVEGCTKEGTQSFDGYGCVEYYCTQHYEELIDMFADFLKD